jgi:hypothetical protein
MFKLPHVTGVFALGILCCAGFGQPQQPPSFSRDICVKVRDGKGAEYAAFLRDTTMKLAKVRLDAGMYASFVIAQAIEPVGRSARCDYHLVYGYTGFPPEGAGAEQTVADMKKAGITMTREQMNAKRDELSYLVGVDIWRGSQSVGTPVKGGYARLNYFKTKPGANLGEWLRMESTGWKPLAEAMAKDSGTAWFVFGLAMPGGTSLPYNGLTVDAFPSWDALGKGVPPRATWNKVHPEMDYAAYTNQLGNLVERPRVDTVRLVEVMGGK